MITLDIRNRARLAGLVYLLATVALVTSVGLSGDLLVDDSVPKTAANVLQHGTKYSTLFTINLVAVALTIGLVALLDELLSPVSARLSRLATYVALTGCGVQAVLNVFLYGARALIFGTPYRDSFRPTEFQAIAHLCLTIFDQGLFVAIVFFGLYGVLIGYLAYKSTFLPRVIGIAVGLGGLGWAMLIVPYAVSDDVWTFAVVVGVFGQLAMSFWLLAKGVHADRWRTVARTRGGNDEETTRGGHRAPADVLTFSSENLTRRPTLLN